MSKTPPVPKAVTTWVYYVSRDSRDGVLSDKCCLWYSKPKRSRDRGVAWWYGTGAIGQYPLEDIERWFGHPRIPETDIQLFVIEMGVTQRMLDESAKGAAKQ